jgi:hypothetical protein
LRKKLEDIRDQALKDFPFHMTMTVVQSTEIGRKKLF